MEDGDPFILSIKAKGKGKGKRSKDVTLFGVATDFIDEFIEDSLEFGETFLEEFTKEDN